MPPEVRDLLAAVRHPLRLPVLLVLEQQPCTAAQLAAALEAGPDDIQYALRQLRAAGLIETVGERPTRGTIQATVYGPVHAGWQDLLGAVRQLLAGPRPKRSG